MRSMLLGKGQTTALSSDGLSGSPTPLPPQLRAKAANLLSAIRAERARLDQNLRGLQLHTARTLETTRSLQNQFTDVPRALDTREAARRLRTLSLRQRQILDQVVAGAQNK